ncbi:MAG: hypothetical protein ACK4ND_04110 [Cytophagaceae bacterium]
MLKKVLVSLALSLWQLFVYFICFYAGWGIGNAFFYTHEMNETEAFGIAIFFIYSLILFGIIITIGNLLIAVINKPIWSKRIFATMVVFSLIHWGQEFTTYPYKSILFIFTALLAIFSRYFFIFIYDKLRRKVFTF